MSKLLRKISEPFIYRMGEKMGYSEQEINTFQLKRIGLSLLCFWLGIGLFKLLGLYGLGGCFLLGILFWFDQRKRLISRYKNFSFVRQVSFSKFCRMLIPYLLVENQGKSLYAIFSHLAKRIEGDSLQEPLYQLLTDMNDYPNEIEPFIHFAENCSGTDEAINFMTTLFYFQQSSDDPTIIQELGRLANDELFAGVKEIVDMKVRRFGKYPMFVVFSLGVPMFGMMGAFVWEIIKGNLLMK
ncbi:hypothetical protein [Enterococcus sp. DIV1420a]|uniref:hypothetical protein n=1 Tax=Enterococcus sp. DIV1420a TaxID=2774672 RepID=UPI003F220BA3